MTRIKRVHVLFAAMAVALCVPAAGISSGKGLPTSVGKGEGQLNLIAWEGYTQPQWVKPFEKATGCQVNAKYAGSSDEMVTLMRQGGGSQYDGVSASGDASLRLIYGQTQADAASVMLARHWGLLVGCVGLLLIYAAFEPAVRVHFMIFAVAEKVALGALILGSALRRQSPAAAIAVGDLLISLIYVVYLVELWS